MTEKLLTLLLPLILKLIPKASDSLRKLIEDHLKQWRAHAAETGNPLDDVLVDLIATTLGVADK